MTRRYAGGILKARCFMGFVCFCLIVMTATGCEPFRKKFTRKKKDQKRDEIIPVLEPLDYPDKVRSSKEIYRHRYSLWQVWHKDLMTAIKYKESDKSILYMLGQMVVQIDEMQKVVNESTYEGLEAIKKDLAGVQKEFQKPAGMRNYYILENKLIRIDRKFRKNYSPRLLKDELE